VLCGGTTTTWGYDLANEVLSESYSGGVLDGLGSPTDTLRFLRRTYLTGLGSGVLARTLARFRLLFHLARSSVTTPRRCCQRFDERVRGLHAFDKLALVDHIVFAHTLQMGSRKCLSSQLHHWRKTNEKHG